LKIDKLISPGVVTAGNMLFGFLAIIKAFEGQIIAAGWFIVIAAIMDSFDGKLARLMKKGSKFGIEFDSIADMVSFGVAPAVIAYMAYFRQFEMWGAFIVFSQVLFGGFRLAKFNLTASSESKGEFVGLPIPMAALSIVTFVHFNTWLDKEFGTDILILYFPLLISVCLLMVSGVKYDTFPKFTFKESKHNKAKLIFLIGSLAVIAIQPMAAFFLLIIFVVLQGVVRSLFRTLKKTQLKESKVKL
jgi:CDP-diacylglycerol---serine O-phosphatidyltransferase